MKLTVAQLEDLATIYKHILISPELLVETAARRRSSVRSAYESLLTSLAQIERDIALAKKQEGVK